MHLQKYIFCGGFAKKDGIIWAFCALLSFVFSPFWDACDVGCNDLYENRVFPSGITVGWKYAIFVHWQSGVFVSCSRKNVTLWSEKGKSCLWNGLRWKAKRGNLWQNGLWFLCRYRVKIAGKPQSCIGKSKQVVKKKSEVAIVFAGLCWQPPSF